MRVHALAGEEGLGNDPRLTWACAAGVWTFCTDTQIALEGF